VSGGQWSDKSTAELMDMAQAEMEKSPADRNWYLADLMMKAAQARATQSLEWTIENRIGPTISQAIWDGGRR
jgi:hypothetical protein